MTLSKEKISALFIAMLLCFGVMFAGNVQTVKAGAIGNTDVTIDGDGNLSISGDDFGSEEGTGGAFNELIKKYRGLIVGFSGLALVTLIGIFILNFIKLANSGDNPTERAKAQSGLMWSAIGAAGMGSVSMIVGLFYRFLE